MRATKNKDSKLATGKRKRAIARISLKPGTGKVTINGKDVKDYVINRELLFKKLKMPFELTGTIDQFDIEATVKGGGVKSQVEALMYGIAKSLALANKSNRTNLKAAGLLSRDSRIKERKKYGRKKARKSFQFSKR